MVGRGNGSSIELYKEHLRVLAVKNVQQCPSKRIRTTEQDEHRCTQQHAELPEQLLLLAPLSLAEERATGRT